MLVKAILFIVFGPIIALILTRAIANRLSSDIARRAIYRFPLSGTNYYRFFYRMTPLMGGFGGFLGSLGVETFLKLLMGIALGTMVTTILLYLIVDPIVTLFEYLIFQRHRDKMSLSCRYKKAGRPNVSSRDQPERTPEKWLISVSFWIPRKYREAIIGDIMEDCHELRELSTSEFRVCIHIIWQLAIALIMLWPVAILCSLSRILHIK